MTVLAHVNWGRFAPLPPRWADPRLRRAHALIEEVLNGFPPNCESDAASAVFEAMEAVEAADCALDGGE